MTYKKMFKKSWITTSFLLFSLLLILLLNGCKKDIADRPAAQTPVTNEQAFYSLPKTLSSFFQRIALEIKQEDNQRHFLDRMISEDGFPIWDKSEVHVPLPGDAVLGANDVIVSRDTVVFVPLVLKNTAYVNSFLVCKVGDAGVSIKIFKGRYYQAFGYSTNNSSLSAEAIASKIMHLDYLVFGYTFFKITDKYLFNANRQSNNNNFVNIAQNNGSDSGIMNHLSVSITYTECNTVVTDGTQGQVVGVAPGEVPNYSTTEEVCYPVTVFLPDGGGSGGSGIPASPPPTGGSGGGSGPLPGSNPCPVSNTLVAAPTPGCPGSIGWQPAPVPTPVPVASTTTSADFDPNTPAVDPDLQWWDDNTTTYPPQVLPSWSNMAANYPRDINGNDLPADQVYLLIGGDLLAMKNASPSAFLNACAARVSRALNYSGVTIPNIPNQTYKGGDGKYYFIVAAKLYNWMMKTFKASNPIILNNAQGGVNGANFEGLLSGNKGIFIMKPTSPQLFGATGHATLYDGSGCVGGVSHCYFNAKGGVDRIVLFKLN